MISNFQARLIVSFKAPKNYIPSIQILRGIAAWLVVFHHYNQAFFGFSMETSILGKEIGYFTQFYGKFGVDIFFIVSGIIILISLEKKRSFYIFIRNRLIRIVPTYWFFTLVLLTLSIMFPAFVVADWTAESLLKSLFFIEHDHPKYNIAVPLLTVGWTLNIEIVFYLLCAISAGLFKQHWSSLVIIILLFSNTLWNVKFMSFFFDSKYLWEFAAGMVLGRLYIDGKIPDNNALGFALFTVVLVSFITLGPKTQATFILLPIMVLGAMCLKEKMLNNKISQSFEFLGKVSYSTYLCHSIILQFLAKHFNSNPGSMHETLYIIFYLAAVLMISILSFQHIENGFMTQMIKKRYS